VIAAAQLVGAVGRILIGHLSDIVGSRVRVLRWVAASGVITMTALAGVGELRLAAPAAIILIAASAVSVADNGLSFTSVAEAAGHRWAGKALGIQNTGQFIAASAVGPGIGALIAVLGYPAAFALVALAPLAAYPLIPSADRTSPSSPQIPPTIPGPNATPP
jgi:MFS family permease